MGRFCFVIACLASITLAMFQGRGVGSSGAAAVEAKGGDDYCWAVSLVNCPNAAPVTACTWTKCKKHEETDPDGLVKFYYPCERRPMFYDKNRAVAQYPSAVKQTIENGWKDSSETKHSCWQRVLCNKGCKQFEDGDYWCTVNAAISGSTGFVIPRIPKGYPDSKKDCVVAPAVGAADTTLSGTGSTTLP